MDRRRWFEGFPPGRWQHVGGNEGGGTEEEDIETTREEGRARVAKLAISKPWLNNLVSLQEISH